MDTRKEYTDKLKTRLDEWNRTLDELEQKISKASSERKSALRAQVTELRERRGKLEKDLARLREAGDEAWEDIQMEIEDAWVGVKVALQRARERIAG